VTQVTRHCNERHGKSGYFESSSFRCTYGAHSCGPFDASTFGSIGNNHLVQNNFGASFGGPLVRKDTFFFANFEGLRLAQADVGSIEMAC
jgi:hypothetical protein